MIAAFVLGIGGIRLILRKKDRKHGALMLVMAAVLIGNVLVWTI